MSELIIRTSFGEMRFSYNGEQELTTTLQCVESQIKLAEEAISKIAPPKSRLPKVGYEKLYRFTDSGKLELFRFPDERTKLVALALFAYSPDTLTPEEIEEVTGIENIGNKVLWQTKNREKNYFRKVGDRYGLHPEGYKLATEAAAALHPTNDATEEKQE